MLRVLLADAISTLNKLKAKFVSCRNPMPSRSAELYVTQLTPATLSLTDLNLYISQTSSMFEPGRTAVSNLTVQPLIGTDPVQVSLYLRIPGYVRPHVSGLCAYASRILAMSAAAAALACMQVPGNQGAHMPSAMCLQATLLQSICKRASVNLRFVV